MVWVNAKGFYGLGECRRFLWFGWVNARGFYGLGEYKRFLWFG